MTNTILGALCALYHLLFKTTLWSKDHYYHPSFRDEKTEATLQESVRDGIKNPDSLAL